MTKHKLIAIDLAKNVFQVCCINRNNKPILNKQIKRKDLLLFIQQQEPTQIAMEACYSSHYWARPFEDIGHTVSLIPAQHVTPFVRGNKSDKNDAIAIAEAAMRPNIKSVQIKSIEQQDIQALHRIRERHISQRTALMNQLRSILAEYGLIFPQGHASFCKALRLACEPNGKQIANVLKSEISMSLDEYYFHTERIEDINTSLLNTTKNNPVCRILLSIPGIGPINATALYSAIGNASQFKNGRELAVWLGLTPKQASSGETSKSGGITKRGNRYLRKQLVHGARALTSRAAQQKPDSLSKWILQLKARRGPQKTYVAVAAKLARTAWVLLNKNELYHAQN